MAKATQPAPVATPAAPAQSTKPGNPAPAAKKAEKVAKVVYPGLKPDAEGKPTEKLTAWPTDHDPKIHKGLRPKDFANEAPFLRHQADLLEQRVARLRKQADTSEKLGNAADRAKVKKLQAMHENFNKLREQLKAQGIDPDAFIAQMSAAPAPEAAKS